MIKTQMLYAGDLVAVHHGNELRIGMIYEFNKHFTSYKIQWFGKQIPDTTCGWITAQEYRNIYLAFRLAM
jgi:hypothetical protein